MKVFKYNFGKSLRLVFHVLIYDNKIKPYGKEG